MTTAWKSTLPFEIENRGFATTRLLSDLQVDELARALPTPNPEEGGQRNLLELADVRDLAGWIRTAEPVQGVLGASAKPVRGILFDKTPDANWKVTWHQDVTIAVSERREVPGFGPWSVKAGVVHVQPPVTILEAMLSVRVHLDDCNSENGPLRVLPGSHRHGRIHQSQIEGWRSRVPEEICEAARGSVLLMRPLLLHASSPATSPSHRRVLHLDYAFGELPGGLEWRWLADDRWRSRRLD